jgi:hypothetical protein
MPANITAENLITEENFIKYMDRQGETWKDLARMLYNRMPHDELVEITEEWGTDEDEDEDEKCVECDEVVEGEEGWRDSKMKLFCDGCKKEADNYEAEDEECPGDEADYDYEPCCDTGCKYKGHYYKKTEADKTDGRTDGEDEDEEERKWAAHFVKSEALSS